MSAEEHAATEGPAMLIRPLTSDDGNSVAAFTCGESDLDEFLRDDALRLQESRVATTYLAFDGAELVGYVTVLADAVVLRSGERKTMKLKHADHPVVPALKIARLAVSTARRGRGTIGPLLLKYAAALAYAINDRVACRLLTLDAYPKAITFYTRHGFVFNRAQRQSLPPPCHQCGDVVTATCTKCGPMALVDAKGERPSMRFDLFAPVLPDWVPGS